MQRVQMVGMNLLCSDRDGAEITRLLAVSQAGIHGYRFAMDRRATSGSCRKQQRRFLRRVREWSNGPNGVVSIGERITRGTSALLAANGGEDNWTRGRKREEIGRLRQVSIFPSQKKRVVRVSLTFYSGTNWILMRVFY